VSFTLVTSASYWLILSCLLAGLGYACILYYRNKNNGFSRTVSISLFILRTVAVALIASLLLSPLIRNTVRTVEKPVIAIGLDQSESILIGRDSATYREMLVNELDKLSEMLSSKFEVAKFGFADQTTQGFSEQFTGKQTDISQFLAEIRTRYANRNLASVILASDGIVTRGTDPVYAAEKDDFNIYAIGLGDTTQQKDLLISRVNYNRIAYLGNNFPVEITIAAHQCKGFDSKVELIADNQSLFSREFKALTDHQAWTIPVSLVASKAGVMQYRIRVTAIKGEISYENNSKDFFVEVLDGRQKILLLSSAPHPDIAALRAAIERNQNYELEEHAINEFNDRLEPYSLIILHQVPSISDAGTLILSRIKELRKPVMYFIGNQSNLVAFNSLQEGLAIPPGAASFTSAYPALNDNFEKFSISREVESMIADYPPLSVPFGQYKAGPSSEVLFFQKIGNISTKIPMVSFSQGVDSRSAVVAGEGIWRWRLVNYLKAGNHEAFDGLIFKMIQYLAVKSDQSKFRVFHKNQYKENEEVEFDAELYNDSYELINEPDVTITLNDANGKSFPFSFTRTDKAYYLNAGSLSSGQYTYKALASVAGTPYQKTGTFVITGINDEALETVADHTMLYTLASQHNGRLYYPDQLEALGKSLLESSEYTSVSYTQKKYTDLVSVFWFFLLILALLSTEWFLRKRNGGY